MWYKNKKFVAAVVVTAWLAFASVIQMNPEGLDTKALTDALCGVIECVE